MITPMNFCVVELSAAGEGEGGRQGDRRRRSRRRRPVTKRGQRICEYFCDSLVDVIKNSCTLV